MKLSIYLSRAQYSWLVVNHPDAMALGVWQRLKRRWYPKGRLSSTSRFGGVHVSGTPEEIREVCEMLGRLDLLGEES